MWEIDLRFAPGLPPWWHQSLVHRPLGSNQSLSPGLPGESF